MNIDANTKNISKKYNQNAKGLSLYGQRWFIPEMQDELMVGYLLT